MAAVLSGNDAVEEREVLTSQPSGTRPEGAGRPSARLIWVGCKSHVTLRLSLGTSLGICLVMSPERSTWGSLSAILYLFMCLISEKIVLEEDCDTASNQAEVSFPNC